MSTLGAAQPGHGMRLIGWIWFAIAASLSCFCAICAAINWQLGPAWAVMVLGGCAGLSAFAALCVWIVLREKASVGARRKRWAK